MSGHEYGPEPRQVQIHEDRFTRVVFGVLTSLVAAGVIGIWSMSMSLTRLDERLSHFSASLTEKIAAAIVRIEKVEGRVDGIERGDRQDRQSSQPAQRR